MNMIELKSELASFTGSERFHCNPLCRKQRFTDGVLHMADQAGAYWLIDVIFSHQTSKAAQATEFQVWKIVSANGQATVTMTDGDTDTPIIQQSIPATDFPAGQLDLWYADNTLYLPSEH